MKAPIIIATLALFGGTASANEFGGFGGTADLHYEVEGLHAFETDQMAPPEARDFVMAGARLHGLLTRSSRFGYHAGLDLAAGGSINGGGFAYDVSIFPAGVGMRMFQTSFITIGAGIGANGATGTLDDALTFPLEARFEFGRAIRVIGRARATYLFNARERKDGGVSTSFADELEGMLAVRIGHAYDDFGFPTGKGYFLGVTYREQLGARYVGAVLGLSLDMSTKRKGSRYSGSDGYDGCPDCD